MKLSDEQIEQALHCCQWAVKNCKECPLDPNTPCATNLHIATLDYINRLKEEVTQERRIRPAFEMCATIDGDKIGLYDGIITIICDDAREGRTPRVKKLYQTSDGTPDEPFTFTSLNDCLKIIEFDGEGVVMVIFEEGLKGEIYEYGNYTPKCWVKHGTTKGYA
ncbi:MAG: hypothetical protein NC489_23145 [Ruminococcus flavefaciens]|nr:hypothetical protein [Ruminococcus flavefaciens]